MHLTWAKRVGLAFLILPIALFVIWISYEILGMCVNHAATWEQTKTLQKNLENEILDIEIIDVYSETGNTSGTGNHVECLSMITFSTKMQEMEIEKQLSKYYVFDEWDCYVEKADEGYYVIRVNTAAPFADNIEGH